MVHLNIYGLKELHFSSYDIDSTLPIMAGGRVFSTVDHMRPQVLANNTHPKRVVHIYNYAHILDCLYIKHLT